MVSTAFVVCHCICFGAQSLGHPTRRDRPAKANRKFHTLARTAGSMSRAVSAGVTVASVDRGHTRLVARGDGDWTRCCYLALRTTIVALAPEAIGGNSTFVPLESIICIRDQVPVRLTDLLPVDEKFAGSVTSKSAEVGRF
jgi:hypothetical protein